MSAALAGYLFQCDRTELFALPEPDVALGEIQRLGYFIIRRPSNIIILPLKRERTALSWNGEVVCSGYVLGESLGCVRAQAGPTS